MVKHLNYRTFASAVGRIGLTIGKPGKCPGPRAWISKHFITVF